MTRVTVEELRARWSTGHPSALAIPYNQSELDAGIIGLRAAGFAGPNDVLSRFAAAVLDAVRSDPFSPSQEGGNMQPVPDVENDEATDNTAAVQRAVDAASEGSDDARLNTPR